MKNYPDGPPPPRTFSMNSKEFYEAVTRPPEPHMWGPGLPNEPRVWDQPVIIEPRAKRTRRLRWAVRTGGMALAD